MLVCRILGRVVCGTRMIVVHTGIGGLIGRFNAGVIYPAGLASAMLRGPPTGLVAGTSTRTVACAIGTITGAMVFQSSVITAIGNMMTPWHLNHAAFVTVFLTYASVGLAYAQIRLKKKLTPTTLLAGGFFYATFLVLVYTGTL